MGVIEAKEERIILGTEEKKGQHVGIKIHCRDREVVTPLREDMGMKTVSDQCEDKHTKSLKTNDKLIHSWDPINVGKGLLRT